MLAAAALALVIPAASAAPAAPVITAPSDGALLAFTHFAVEGTAEPGARVSLTDVAGGTDVVPVAADGSWSVTRDWTNATHTVTARTLDAAGNQSAASAAVRFTVDAYPPIAPSIDSPMAGSVTRQTEIPVSGRSEPAATVTVSGSGGQGSALVDGNGHWEMTLTFAEGQQSIMARARDVAGNTSASSAAVSFTVDLTPPAIPVIATPAEGAVLPARDLAAGGTADPGTTVQVLRGTAVVASTTTLWDRTWSVALPNIPNGSVAVTARARDTAGNVSALSPVRTFDVDGIPPTVTVSTPSGTIFIPFDTPTFEGTASDNKGVREIHLDFYDVTGRGVVSFRAKCGACPAKTVGWVSTDSPLVGRFVVRAYALDIVGNRSDFAEFVVTIVRLS